MFSEAMIILQVHSIPLSFFMISEATIEIGTETEIGKQIISCTEEEIKKEIEAFIIIIPTGFERDPVLEGVYLRINKRK